MINSRKLSDLNHFVEKKANDFILTCECNQIQIIVTSTYRDADAQALLYAQGRTSPGHLRRGWQALAKSRRNRKVMRS